MKKILIVEDEIIIALDVARRLSKLGYFVTETATKPVDALNSITQDMPDIIIMDINLKADLDGIQLAEKVKTMYNIPVIYMTSYSDSSMIERAMYTEPYGYIIKPYSEGVLAATLKTSFTRLELEEKTTQQNEMLNNIMDSITDAVVMIDFAGVVQKANKRFCDLFEFEDPSEKNITEVVNNALRCEDIKRLYDERAQEIFPVTVNGTVKHVLFATSDFSWGAGRRILLTITDLTEMYNMKSALSDAEVRFTKIFRKKMVPAVLISCEDMKIFEMNEAFMDLYKVDEDLYAEKELTSCISEETVDIINSYVKGEDSFKIDCIVQKDLKGREFYANIRGKRVEFDNMPYFLVDISDITEQVRMEEAEKELQQKLIHANKMTSLGTLVSGVAHEINNPNNFIMFNSSLMIDFWKDVFDLLKEKGVEKLGELDVEEFQHDVDDLMNGIVNGSERIKNIVQDLKGFARTEKSDSFERVSMNEVLGTSVRILEHQIGKSTENFVFNISEDVSDVRGNIQKLEQVFINIIMNALEAIQSNGALVEVKCYMSGDEVIIEVVDEGVGIPSDSLDRITEPFFTTKQGDGGTGLGLSIVYAIVNEHGGVISVDSSVGVGTKVKITLPGYKDEQ